MGVNRNQLNREELGLEMPQVFVTRRETFSAAHRLHCNQLSDEENRELYGPCNNIHGHGHNYSIEVTVVGEPNIKTGMVMNITDLKKIIKTEVMDVLDHKNIDKQVDYFGDGKIVSQLRTLPYSAGTEW